MKKILLFFLLILIFSCNKKEDTTNENCGFSGNVKVLNTNTSVADVVIRSYRCGGPMKYSAQTGHFYCSGDSIMYSEVYTDTSGHFSVPCENLALGFTMQKEGMWYTGRKSSGNYYMAYFSQIKIIITDTSSSGNFKPIRFTVTDSLSGHHFYTDSITGPGTFTKEGICGGNLVNRVRFNYHVSDSLLKDSSLYIYCPVNRITTVRFTKPSK